MIRPVRQNFEPTQVAVERRKRSPQTFKKRDVLRAMTAVREGGLDFTSVEISLDSGTIRLSNAQAATTLADKDEFEKWSPRL